MSSGGASLPRRRQLLRHEAVLAIARARLPLALGRWPVAAAARGLDQEHVALPDRHADFLRLQRANRSAARLEPIAMRQAVLAAEQAVRRVADAVAGRVGDRRLLDIDPQAQHRADAAAMRAVARGIRSELVALEGQRKARLGDLDAAELDPARGLAFARGLPAVAHRRRAAAGARVEHVPDERLP